LTIYDWKQKEKVFNRHPSIINYLVGFPFGFPNLLTNGKPAFQSSLFTRQSSIESLAVRTSGPQQRRKSSADR
jgi:hypothetical protein